VFFRISSYTRMICSSPSILWSVWGRGGPNNLGIWTNEGNSMVQVTYKTSSLSAKVKLLKAKIWYLKHYMMMIVDSNNNFNRKYQAVVSPKFSRHPRMDYQRTTVFYKVTEIEIQGFLSQMSILCKFFTTCMQKSCFLYTVWITLSSLFPKWWHV